MRTVPASFGLTDRVPLFTDPSSASASDPPCAIDGISSEYDETSVYPAGTSKSDVSNRVISILSTSTFTVVEFASTPSPDVVVVVERTGKPSFASPIVFVSRRSVQASADAAGCGFTSAFGVQPAIDGGTSRYHASTSMRVFTFWQAPSLDSPTATVFTCLA